MDDLLELLKKPLNDLRQVSLQDNEILFRQGDPGESMYVVLEGSLQVLITNENNEVIHVGQIRKGEPVGEMQVFTGGKRTASVRAIGETKLAEVPTFKVDVFKEKHPLLYDKLEHLVFRRMCRNHLLLLLPDLFGEIEEEEIQSLEAELEWRHLKKGERLIQEGDEGDAMYLVLSGRLYVKVEDEKGFEQIIMEIGRGETVGEMALYNNDPRTASVDAVRDSMLVHISKATFFSTMSRFPKLHEHVTRSMMHRLKLAANPSGHELGAQNILFLPLHSGVPFEDVLNKIEKLLSGFSSTLRVSRDRLSQMADFSPQIGWFENQSESLRLSVWLDNLERKYTYILFEADPESTSWNKRLVQYADRVILVGDANASPEMTRVELECLEETPCSSQILLLVHDDETVLPSGTSEWLNRRDVARHFHIRKTNNRDIERFGRFLAGKSLGLVLGGGGARGFAHIGVIKAFRELGIPVDMVGGTSMGGVIAAHIAMLLDYENILDRNRRAFVEERPFRKQWLPIFSFYKGKKLDEVTHHILYQDVQLEDLWLPCFVVSCSLGTSEMVVHERGIVWKAIRASTALPGVVTPVTEGRRLHVDGGLMNNLPVDLMRERCPGPIAAVEVGDMFDLDASTLDTPTLGAYFKRRWFGESKEAAFPGVLEILMRSLLIGSRQNVKRARKNADLVLTPPVERFGMLEFKYIEEAAEEGYQYALDVLEKWYSEQQ